MSFAARYLLPTTSILALDAIYGFGFRNGFLDLMSSNYRARILSGTNQPLQGNMTGTGLDELLGNLIVFYWPVLDGNHPGLSLQMFYLMGTVVAFWTVIHVESWRTPYRKKLMLSPTFFAMLSHAIAVCIIGPLWCTIHLWMSSPALSPPSSSSGRHTVSHAFSAPAVHAIRQLPISMIVGFGVPTLAVVLPESSHSHLFTKQEAMALWQLWPMFVSLFHWALCKVTAPNVKPGSSSRTVFRGVYLFAFLAATVPHLISWGLAFSLVPTNLLVDVSPWGTDNQVQVQSMAQGALWFLQWDHLIGMGGFLVWAIHLRCVVTARGQMRFTELSWLAVKVGFLCLVSGPCGAAVWLLWERELLE